MFMLIAAYNKWKVIYVPMHFLLFSIKCSILVDFSIPISKNAPKLHTIQPFENARIMMFINLFIMLYFLKTMDMVEFKTENEC